MGTIFTERVRNLQASGTLQGKLDQLSAALPRVSRRLQFHPHRSPQLSLFAFIANGFSLDAIMPAKTFNPSPLVSDTVVLRQLRSPQRSWTLPMASRTAMSHMLLKLSREPFSL